MRPFPAIGDSHRWRSGGGALADGVGVLETAVKEAAEEANVPESLAMEMRPAGSVSFLHLSKRGIHNNTLFIYDLELPESFEPTNNDGEVSGWQLIPADKVLATITSEEFKVTSSPVALDWLIRHGDLRVSGQNQPTTDASPTSPDLTHLPLSDTLLLGTIDQLLNVENFA